MQKQTVMLSSPPFIVAEASIVGKKEGRGPLGSRFDRIADDARFGQKSWETAESIMLQECFGLVLQKSGLKATELDYLLSGDLLAQCTGSAFAARDTGIPYFGLYGACSTMGESLALAAMLVSGGFAEKICAMTSSHFCSAERQFRTPLEYGAQRCPTAQWTVTGCGAVILSGAGTGPRITAVTPGRIVDAGITDACNMGAAMAPAAADTLACHMCETGRDGNYYDAVITGDLGHYGHALLAELLHDEGLTMPTVFTDCGMLIFDKNTQDTHGGGSGCGCSAAVLCGHILKCMHEGLWKRVLFAPTGALMSPTSSLQGLSIPGICHAIAIESGE